MVQASGFVGSRALGLRNLHLDYRKPEPFDFGGSQGVGVLDGLGLGASGVGIRFGKRP